MTVLDELSLTVLSIFVSALFSGLLGVLISNWYHERNEVRRLKFIILQQLMGNRNDFHCQKFVEAMNQVPIVFHDSREVLLTFKAYQEHIQNKGNPTVGHQRLLEMIKAMYKHLGMNSEPLTDNIFRAVFVTRTDEEKSKESVD